MEYFDSHCHLNDEQMLVNIDEQIALLRQAGITAALCIGYDLASSKRAVELANTYPEIYAAVGIHPDNAAECSKEVIEELRKLAQDPNVIAIGEIGLDYYWHKDPEERAAQKPVFVSQIKLADELGLPISVHARDAIEDTYRILKENNPKFGGVLHCYSGSVEMMREFLKLGLYFGFDGPITYKNAVTPKQCVRECPADRLLVETDSPYLSPTPFRGKPNNPKNIPYIVAEMARIRECDEALMNKQLWKNFKKMFRVKQ